MLKILTRLKKKFVIFHTALKWIFLNSIVTKVCSKHLRNMILRIMGSNIAKDVAIYRNGFIWDGGKLTIDSGTNIGFKVHLDDRCGLYIGKNVTLASEVMIWTFHHDYNSPNFKAVGAPVSIEDYAWICSRAIILPGVTIGKGAVVASGAVVSKDVAPWTVVGGIPAKKINNRKIQNYNYTPSEYWIPFV